MRDRWLSIGLVLLAIAGFTAQVLSISSTRLQPRYDEVQYLSLARDYQRAGGILATVRCHLEGRCLQDNRNPLFEFLLLPFTTNTPTFYATAKLVTYSTALFLFIVSFWCVSRRFSGPVAIGTVVGLCLLTTLAELSAGVLCDVLLAAFGVLTVFLISSISEVQDRGLLRWCAAGAAGGLAYLTKGDGHLFLVGLLVVGLSRHRFRLFTHPGPYIAGASFVAVTFFLLWRNLVVYHAPFVNFNDRTIWLDRWSDVWTLWQSAEWQRIGMFWYLEHHTIWDLAVRITKGFAEAIAVFPYSAGLGPTATPPGFGPLTAKVAVTRAVTGLTVLVCATRGMQRRYQAGHHAEIGGVLSTVGLFFFAFALGAQGVGEIGTRFVIPFVALCLPYAVDELVTRTIPWLGCRMGVPPERLSTQLLVLLGTFLITKIVWFGDAVRDPRRLVEVPPAWSETSRWLSAHLVAGERYAIPSNSVYSTFDQPFPDPDARRQFVFDHDGTTMLERLPREGISKILIDLLDSDLERYQDELARTARDAHGAPDFLGWPRCFADSDAPSRFLVFCSRGTPDQAPR